MEVNKQIFTELIKRQMILLGPEITLSKVKNVPGIQFNTNGDVTGIIGDPQVLLQELINQFIELSGMIVKKTMESIMSAHESKLFIQGHDPIINVTNLNSLAWKPLPPNPVVNSPKVQPVPDSVAPKNEPDNMERANQHIEELNKMLNNKVSS